MKANNLKWTVYLYDLVWTALHQALTPTLPCVRIDPIDQLNPDTTLCPSTHIGTLATNIYPNLELQQTQKITALCQICLHGVLKYAESFLAKQLCTACLEAQSYDHPTDETEPDDIFDLNAELATIEEDEDDLEDDDDEESQDESGLFCISTYTIPRIHREVPRRLFSSDLKIESLACDQQVQTALTSRPEQVYEFTTGYYWLLLVMWACFGAGCASKLSVKFGQVWRRLEREVSLPCHAVRTWKMMMMWPQAARAQIAETLKSCDV